MRKSKIKWLKKYNEYRVDLIRYYESTRLTMEIIYDTVKITAELLGVHVEHALDLNKDKKTWKLYGYGERLAVYYIESHPAKWFVKNRYLCNRKCRHLVLSKEERIEKIKRIMKSFTWKDYVRTEGLR